MDKAQLKAQIDMVMSEFFDGYVLIGQVAGKPDMVVTMRWEDQETRHKLLCGLVNVVNTATLEH